MKLIRTVQCVDYALTNSILDVFDDCEPYFAVVALLDRFHGVADHM